MGDPELRSDEKVLVRTPGVYVKSIPFEGILTNKRIILIDRAKNLLPPKEIPLVTIKEVESGENAIRDQIITLSVMAKTGETRQMILTFSRQAGGNRIKERDAWARIIKDNASSSFDQVIRKVIPTEPAIRRAEPPAAPRYEVVHPTYQPAAPSVQSPPAQPVPDEIRPVRRSLTTSPVTVVPSSPSARQPEAPAPGMEVFCSKCGNKVPAGSVFCNRCGSPVAQIPQVSAAVYPPAATPFVKIPVARPIDEEIQTIEPLIERSTVRVPPDPLRAPPVERSPVRMFSETPQTPPVESSLRPSPSWDHEEEQEPESLPEEPIPGDKPPAKGFLPRLFSAKSAEAATPSPVQSYGDSGDTPPPPKPPRSSSFMPGRQTILTGAIAVVVILLLAAGALFVYPMLTSGSLAEPSGSGDVTPTTPSAPSTVVAIGTVKVKETQAPVIPPTGVQVHVNYLGGFKGSYGLTDAITTVPGNSGDRVWEVENATNGTVQATFEKLDGSTHELVVEIYKDGKLLTSGTTTVGHGSVTLSVDMITGKAAAPITSGGGTTAAAVAAVVSAPAAPVLTTTAAVSDTTTVAITAPAEVTTTTTVVASTTTASP